MASYMAIRLMSHHLALFGIELVHTKERNSVYMLKYSLINNKQSEYMYHSSAVV